MRAIGLKLSTRIVETTSRGVIYIHGVHFKKLLSRAHRVKICLEYIKPIYTYAKNAETFIYRTSQVYNPFLLKRRRLLIPIPRKKKMNYRVR